VVSGRDSVDTAHDLFVVFYDAATKLLFINSSRRRSSSLRLSAIEAIRDSDGLVTCPLHPPRPRMRVPVQRRTDETEQPLNRMPQRQERSTVSSIVAMRGAQGRGCEAQDFLSSDRRAQTFPPRSAGPVVQRTRCGPHVVIRVVSPSCTG
jgi:hypothetical protein